MAESLKYHRFHPRDMSGEIGIDVYYTEANGQEWLLFTTVKSLVEIGKALTESGSIVTSVSEPYSFEQ